MQYVFLIQQYNQEITDLNQPVLISQSRRKRGSMISGPVVLIPELCYLTGTVAIVASHSSICQTIPPTETDILTATSCQVN